MAKICARSRRKSEKISREARISQKNKRKMVGTAPVCNTIK